MMKKYENGDECHSGRSQHQNGVSSLQSTIPMMLLWQPGLWPHDCVIRDPKDTFVLFTQFLREKARSQIFQGDSNRHHEERLKFWPPLTTPLSVDNANI